MISPVVIVRKNRGRLFLRGRFFRLSGLLRLKLGQNFFCRNFDILPLVFIGGSIFGSRREFCGFFRFGRGRRCIIVKQ